MLVLALTAGLVWGADGAPPVVPRGKPIRPATPATAVDPSAPGAVRLPGGILITNLPSSVLPKSATNVVRLPTAAARRFEPLGYLATSFTVLSRFFLAPPEAASVAQATPTARWESIRGQVPQDVLELDGRKVAIAGFMLPVTLNEGRTTEFLLLRSQSACCFGMVPRVNELIIVKVPAPGVVPKPDVPVVVGGTLSLRWIGEGGQLTAIYDLAGDKVERVEEKEPPRNR